MNQSNVACKNKYFLNSFKKVSSSFLQSIKNMDRRLSAFTLILLWLHHLKHFTLDPSCHQWIVDSMLGCLLQFGNVTMRNWNFKHYFTRHNPFDLPHRRSTTVSLETRNP